MKPFFRSLVLFATLALAGCSGTTSMDASTDVVADTGMTSDAFVDGARDVVVDAAADTTIDSGDAVADVGTDTAPDIASVDATDTRVVPDAATDATTVDAIADVGLPDAPIDSNGDSAATCPPTAPATGSSCSTPAQMCNYTHSSGGIITGSICTCQSTGMWHCLLI